MSGAINANDTADSFETFQQKNFKWTSAENKILDYGSEKYMST
jgi:hypothetical protein